MNLRTLWLWVAVFTVFYFGSIGITFLVNGYPMESVGPLLVTFVVLTYFIPGFWAEIMKSMTGGTAHLKPIARAVGSYAAKQSGTATQKFKDNPYFWLSIGFGIASGLAFVSAIFLQDMRYFWVGVLCLLLCIGFAITHSNKWGEIGTWWKDEGLPKAKESTEKGFQGLWEITARPRKACSDWLSDRFSGKKGNCVRFFWVTITLLALSWLFYLHFWPREVKLIAAVFFALAIFSAIATVVFFQIEKVVPNICPEKKI